MCQHLVHWAWRDVQPRREPRSGGAHAVDRPYDGGASVPSQNSLSSLSASLSHLIAISRELIILSNNEAAAPKKGKQGKKGKGGHGPKVPTQAAQKDKTIEMQKQSLAKKDAELAEKDAEATKKDAEVAQLRAEIAQLCFDTSATGQPTQEPALTKPAPKKEPLPRARQRPASPQPAERTTPPEAGSPLKQPPSLHVMAQRASALSPGRTRSSGGSQGSESLHSHSLVKVCT